MRGKKTRDVSDLQFAASVKLLQLPLRGVHVGEACSFAKHPRMLQRLLYTQTLMRVQNYKLADL